MIQPGQVVRLYNVIAGKPKYHLCISLSRGFLFLNSPKPKQRPGDLVVPCSDFPFLQPTATGDSVICCTTIVHLSNGELNDKRTKIMGQASKDLLLKVFEFVEGAEFLSEADQEDILGGLEDWL